MVCHQAICMTDPAESIDNVSQDLEESGWIVLAEKDALSRIPAAGDVVDSAFVFQSQRSGHDVRSLPRSNPKNKGLTPYLTPYPLALRRRIRFRSILSGQEREETPNSRQWRRVCRRGGLAW